MLGICKTLEQEKESVISVQQRELPYSQKAKVGKKEFQVEWANLHPKAGGGAWGGEIHTGNCW